jgi:hypothetical protein
LAEAEDLGLPGLHQQHKLKHKSVDQGEELILQVKAVQLELQLELRHKVLMVETNQDLILFIIQAQAAEELEELFP